MPEHTIEAGETLSSIAATHGLPSEKAILEAPENREYLEKRPDPHTLQPGETVFVPEKAADPPAVRTGSVHRMVVELKRLRVLLPTKWHGARRSQNLFRSRPRLPKTY